MAEMHTDYDVEGIIKDLRDNKYSDDEIKGFLKDKFGDQTVNMYFPEKGAQTLTSPAPQESEMYKPAAIATAAGVGTSLATMAGKKIYDRFIKKPEPLKEKIEPTFGTTPEPKVETPITNIEKQLQGIDVNKLPKDQRELVGTLVDAERKRLAKQQEATSVVRQQLEKPGFIPNVLPPPVNAVSPIAPSVPTVAQLGQQALGQAPVAPPQTVEQVASEAVAPTEGKKKGRPPGAKNMTAEQRALEESTKGMNMYRNMFGYDAKNPESPKSLAAVDATNRLINEGFGGQLPASRDPMLNPATDLTKEGKKFYSGTPEGYRNTYIPWLQENLHTLPPETQSHVLHSMTKGQTGDIGKIMKGMGIAGLLGATGAAFAGPSETRARDIRNAIGEALLPLGVTPSEVQPGTLDEKRLRAFQESQKLGSPYRSVPPPQ